MASLKSHISVKILDDLGVTASAPYYITVDDTQTVASINVLIQDIITDLDAITDGQILSVSLDVDVPLPTVKTAPVTGAEVERGGLFNWSQANVKYKFGILVPAFKKSLIVDGKINLSDAAVIAWNDLMSTIGGHVDWISTGGNLLSAFTDALLVFRKHRKAEARRSYEV